MGSAADPVSYGRALLVRGSFSTLKRNAGGIVRRTLLLDCTSLTQTMQFLLGSLDGLF